MNLNFYKISPLDTLFFRDGHPYNLGESNQNNVESIFPPNPYTIVGGLRAAIAKNLGWDGKSSWTDQITSKIGSDDNLNNLSFYGPFIMVENDKNKEILFPLPKNIRLKKSEENNDINEKPIKSYQLKKIKPNNTLLSDIGEINYPLEPNDDSGKYIYINGYVNKSDLERLLEDEEENIINEINVYTNDYIFEKEYIVGIKRNASKLTVEEGNLFSRRFVRMKDNIHLIIGCHGCEELLTKINGSLIMLGGESKGAYVQKIDNIELPKVKSNHGSKFIVYFATPTRLSSEISLNKEIKDIKNAKLVSGCIDKPAMIGGWDSRKGPKELKPFIPAGTVFFMENNKNDGIEDLNNTKIGEDSNFGFGHILIGKW